jgi:hypothetical protein
MHLITTAVKPDSWQDMGGFGTISEYKGLIVINHRLHHRKSSVLKMLAKRLTADERSGGRDDGADDDAGGGPMPVEGLRRNSRR